MKNRKLDELKIGVVGLGYVGLPLAVELSRYFSVTGFDTCQSRINALRKNLDETKEISQEYLMKNCSVFFTDDQSNLSNCNFFIITVPTPIDIECMPDLTALRSASQVVGKILKVGAIVVYESTVYPGATEEVCVPILEAESGLLCGIGFEVGYSPERINPGDKEHSIRDIKKIVSATSECSLTIIDQVYRSIVDAGTFKASTIREAEAAKVIENTQRDINIALINELVFIFDELGLNTQRVLEAASTKWNFLKFRPGLVGGHCIGVDPYYLTKKATDIGINPKLILAGRSTNDSMADYVANKFIDLHSEKEQWKTARVLVMGCTFKENVRDVRNSKVFKVIERLTDSGLVVDVYDPWVEREILPDNISLVNKITRTDYSGVFVAVPHEAFKSLRCETLLDHCTKDPIIFDLYKTIFSHPDYSF